MSVEIHVLDAAERLFAAHGYAGVGVDAIASGAGSTPSTIYRRFSGKEAILSALFDRVQEELLTRLGPSAPDPRDELEHLIDVHASFARERPELAVILVREIDVLPDNDRRVFQRRRQVYLDRWDTALAACYPRQDPTALAAARDGLHWLLISPAVSHRAPAKPDDATTATLRAIALAALSALDTITADRTVSDR